jgi:hypothetical protein
MPWTNKPFFVAAVYDRRKSAPGQGAALRRLPPAARRLAALVLLAAALPATAADPSNSAPATLILRNGDSMDGSLLSIDARRLVRWKNADVAGPVEFILDSISQLDLHPPAPPERGANSPCNVFLTQGDVLEGSLLSCSRDTLALQTWYAGQLKIPRKQVQSIYFFPTTPDIFTVIGPEGWTQGATAAFGAGTEAGSWIFRDGAFYSAKSASIGRDLKLPDTADLQFDLAWSGDLSLSLALYTDSLQPIALLDKDDKTKVPDFGSFYSMRFVNMFVEVARIKKMETPIISFPMVVVPAFSQTNRVHIEVRARKKSNTLALAVEGQWLQVWNDTNGFCGEGTGLRFVHNVLAGGGKSQIKISNLRLAPWDGVWEADQTNLPPSDQDVAWLTNSTSLAGVIESVADGKVTLRGKRDKVEIPLGRVRRLAFAPPQEEPAREWPGTVHAVFAHGGPLTFLLDGWTADGVDLRSPVFGPARFNPNAFRRLVFQPLDTAVGAGTNTGTGLR